ncbi:MAG: lipocalin family protein [Bacteroidia bacterium]
MDIKKAINCILIATMITFFSACSSIPGGAAAVSPFKKEKYLGKWYEIARFDYRFERDLNNTTAEYSLKENGKIKVVNQGYNYVKKKWTKAIGKAKFAKDENTGMLKVSFFGPFYSGYNVISLEGDYQYALIAGSSLDYLWILSKEKSIPENVKSKFIAKAQEIGYDTQKLIWVKHD